MKQTRSLAICWSLAVLLFFSFELGLILFVDQPLSLSLRAIDANHPLLIDFFRFWTNLGRSKWYLWPSGIALLITLGLSYWPGFSAERRRVFYYKTKMLGFFFLCVSASGLITDIFKRLIGRARPVLLDRENYYGFDPLSFTNNHHSFPSGHTTTAFAVAFALMVFFPRWRPWLLAYAVALSVSRVMVNAHFLSDTFAGAAVGILSVYLFRELFYWRGWLEPRKG